MLVWVDMPHGVEKHVDEVKKSKKWSMIRSKASAKLQVRPT